MRPLRALGSYTFIVFLGGALLAPWIYWFVHYFSQTFPDLAQKTFQQIASGTMMFVALAGLWPMLRSMGVNSLRQAGFTNPLLHGNYFLAGLLMGVFSLSLVALLALAFGAREIDPRLTSAAVARKLSAAAFTALGVAIIEETLFRGGIFGGLRRVFHWPFALMLSSMVYALSHFFSNAHYEGAVTWVSGLELLPRMFAGSLTLSQALPRFVNLTVAGALLGLAYHRTGNIWFSIGLHAGWIFWLAGYRAITESLPGTAKWLWGGAYMINGWLALLPLLLALIVFTKLPFARKDYFSP